MTQFPNEITLTDTEDFDFNIFGGGHTIQPIRTSSVCLTVALYMDHYISICKRKGRCIVTSGGTSSA